MGSVNSVGSVVSVVSINSVDIDVLCVSRGVVNVVGIFCVEELAGDVKGSFVGTPLILTVKLVSVSQEISPLSLALTVRWYSPDVKFDVAVITPVFGSMENVPPDLDKL